MKSLIFFFLLVVTLEVCWATDTLTFENCESLGIEECEGFRQINISVDEQKKLFSSILEIKENKNIHEFVFDWNTNLEFDENPYIVLPEYHETIRNAWLIVTSVMPSVLYSNTLYNNYSGFVQSDYKYELTKPSDYFNGEWRRCTNNPPTNNGDCRTEYPQNWDLSYIDTYLNNRWLGNTTLLKFNTTDNFNSFESELHIVNKIQRDHFSWSEESCCQCNDCCWYCGRRVCCGRDCGKCGCDKHWQRCGASYTDYEHDELVLTDNKTSKLEQISYSEPVILYDGAESIAYFRFNTTNLDNYKLNVGNVEIIKKNLEYDYDYSYLPSNVLTAQANYDSEINANIYSSLEEQNDTDLISFYLGNNNSHDCNLELHSFFNRYNVSCNVMTLPSTELNITTNGFFYMPNETIKANISISSDASTDNDFIKIRYGDYSINVTGSSSIELTPKLNTNQIYAEYETDLTHQSASAVKTISVYAGEKPKYYTTIFWIIVTFFVFAKILHKCLIKYLGKK